MEDTQHAMDLWETIEVNKEIMRLIRSKYPEALQLQWNPLELDYYKQLEAETEKAKQYLETTVGPEAKPSF
jgi:hypothetical protein